MQEKTFKSEREYFRLGLSHTRRSDASEKIKKILASTFERFRLWTSFESSHVSVNSRLDPEKVRTTPLSLIFLRNFSRQHSSHQSIQGRFEKYLFIYL